MHVAVFGNNALVESICRGLRQAGVAKISILTKPEALRPLNSIDLTGFAREIGASLAEFADLNAPEAQTYLRHLAPDWAFAAWPDLLKAETLDIPRHGIIGSHPTRIPQNKGRHPLHWMIVLGLTEGCVSLFQMTVGVDAGEIRWREPYHLPPEVDIAMATTLVEAAYESAASGLFREILAGRLPNLPPEGDANTWRKRNRFDSLLDPRMSAEMIVRTVRSYAPPFPCAELWCADQRYRVLAAHLVPEITTPLAACEPGRVLLASGNQLRFKAADLVVEVQLDGQLPPNPPRHVYPPLYYIDRGCAFEGIPPI